MAASCVDVTCRSVNHDYRNYARQFELQPTKAHCLGCFPRCLSADKSPHLFPSDGVPHVFSAFNWSHYRLSAFSLITAALILAACNAPLPAPSPRPLAPEIASGYRTDMRTQYASRHMARQPTRWRPRPGVRYCVRAARQSMPPLPCKRC